MMFNPLKDKMKKIAKGAVKVAAGKAVEKFKQEPDMAKLLPKKPVPMPERPPIKNKPIGPKWPKEAPGPNKFKNLPNLPKKRI